MDMSFPSVQIGVPCLKAAIFIFSKLLVKLHLVCKEQFLNFKNFLYVIVNNIKFFTYNVWNMFTVVMAFKGLGCMLSASVWYLRAVISCHSPLLFFLQ